MRFWLTQSNGAWIRPALRPCWNILLFALVVSGQGRAEDWPQFGRDGSRNAVSLEKDAPTWWQLEKRDRQGKLIREGKNIRWVSDLHGRSYMNVPGDPVVAGGLVWVGRGTANDLGDRGIDVFPALVCLDEKTGEEVYRRVSEPLGWNQESGTFHGHGSAPYIEGDTLWVLTNRCEVVCLDIGPLQKRTGPPRERWMLDLYKDLGVRPRAAHYVHRRPSVAAYKDWVYVITGNGTFWKNAKDPSTVLAPDAPSLVCLEKTTGKVVWQNNSPGENIMHSQFATPTIVEVGGRAQVIAPLGDGWVRSFDPATGELLWEYDTNLPGSEYSKESGGADPKSANYLPASAVFHGGLLYIANGQEPEVGAGEGWLHCIDPTRSGDISPEFTRGPDKGEANSNSGLVWRFGGEARWDLRTLANVTVADGLVFAPALGGTLYCLDARTGKLRWEHETTGCIKAAPLVVDGRVYVSTEDGVFVFAASATKQVEGPFGGGTHSICNPVFANGVLYLVNNGFVYAIAGKDKPPDEKDSEPAAAQPSYTPLPTLNAAGESVAVPSIRVAEIPDELRDEYKIHKFYQKHLVIRGIPVIGAEEVTDYAFLECAWTLDNTLHGREKVLKALVSAKVRVGIIGVKQFTMDIPENQRPSMIAKGAYHDRRSRGLGGLPMATCAEENLLNLRGDPYTRENITIHEFAHTLASALRRADRKWWDKLEEAYAEAKEKGIYGRSYASTNVQEYWAEGAQCWFDCANPRNSGGASNRAELKAKDEPLAALLTEVYGDSPWRYAKTDKRTTAADNAHLAKMNRAAYPAFSFNNSPRIKAEAEAGRKSE